jgi:ubiquinone/menaquinone biosynthesis C-methylase UbiE
MQRILEPEVMDTQADAEDYDAMDFGEANTRFAEDAHRLLGNIANPRVLDLGTGTAQIPILMLKRRPDMTVVAVDLAQEMLTVAMKNLIEAKVDDRCQLARMDVKSLRLGSREVFDLVMCNSTAHHLPDPLSLFKEIARVAPASGAIIIRDLIRPETMEDAWQTVRAVAPSSSKHQAQLFFDSLCASLSLSEVEQLVADARLARMRVTQVSDRHWTAERKTIPA